jgi:hypothetical protein
VERSVGIVRTSCRHCRPGLRLGDAHVMGGADRFRVLAVEDLGDRPQGLIGRGTIGGNRRENDHNGGREDRNERHPEAAATGATSGRVHLGIPHRVGCSRDDRLRLDLAPPRQQRLNEQAVSRRIEGHIKSIGCSRRAPDRIQQQVVLPHRDQGVDVEVVLAQTLARTLPIRRGRLLSLPVPVERFRHHTTPLKKPPA